jgi:hypothetical protein
LLSEALFNPNPYQQLEQRAQEKEIAASGASGCSVPDVPDAA